MADTTGLTDRSPDVTPDQPVAARPRKQATGLHWAVLFLSAALEAVWALALSASAGFTLFTPTIIFIITCTLSMFGLAYAMRGIAVSVAYAIWTGTGAALTVAASILSGAESPSVLKLLFLAGIIGCVIGLKFARDPE